MKQIIMTMKAVFMVQLFQHYIVRYCVFPNSYFSDNCYGHQNFTPTLNLTSKLNFHPQVDLEAGLGKLSAFSPSSYVRFTSQKLSKI